MDQKIVKLKAKLAGTLYELLVNTRIDNVQMLDGTLLADKLQEIINAINAREKIVDVDRKIDAASSATELKAQEYTNTQIGLISQTGIPKLMVYPLSCLATEKNQTVFNIDLETFDINTDTVFVQSGRTILSPNYDFIVQGKTIVLTEGVDKDRTIDIYVFKNVPMGEEGSVSGGVIADGSIPLSKLAELPTAEDVGTMRVYKTLEEIGVTTDVSKVTMTEIANALPNYSELITRVNSSWNSEEFPDQYATLHVIKHDSYERCFAYLMSVNSRNMFYGSLNSGDSTFSGWNELYSTKNKPTAYDLSIPVNNNILINSNFANPVNQRGYVSGSGYEGYCIDRWKGRGKATLVDYAYINLNSYSAGETASFYQPIEGPFYKFRGKQVTLSAKIRPFNTTTLMLFIDGYTDKNDYAAIGYQELEISDNDIGNWIEVSKTFTFPSDIAFTYLSTGITTASVPDLDIEWMKLEEGSVATPYVPRLYAEELALCRWYYSVDLLHDSLSTQKTTDWLAFEKVLTRMRIEFPTATLKGCAIRHDYANVDGFTFRVFSYNGFVDVFADKVNHGINNSHSVQIVGEIIRDAEL